MLFTIPSILQINFSLTRIFISLWRVFAIAFNSIISSSSLHNAFFRFVFSFNKINTLTRKNEEVIYRNINRYPCHMCVLLAVNKVQGNEKTVIELKRLRRMRTGKFHLTWTMHTFLSFILMTVKYTWHQTFPKKRNKKIIISFKLSRDGWHKAVVLSFSIPFTYIRLHSLNSPACIFLFRQIRKYVHIWKWNERWLNEMDELGWKKWKSRDEEKRLIKKCLWSDR